MLAQEPLAPIDTPDAPGFIQCTLPVNAGPMHYVFNTAIREMDEWMRSSETPPAAPRLDLNDDGGDSFCRLFGTTALFSAEQMASLYVDEA
ncbi:MAG: hypothetical protein IMF06_10390, partial [Proteobacteria bacterium]|nr:hypothetical protein [Pseudomonadota bacterium]